LVELAVVLPILLVLVVGIFDFGQAFTLKQQLNNIAREAARLGSSQPTADLSQTAPPSVKAIRDLIDSDLKASKIDDCGLGDSQSGGRVSRTGTPDQVTWKAVGATCPAGTLTVTIERATSAFSATLNINVVCTHVNIQYPFQWHFNKVIQLIAPGASGTTNPVPGDAVIPNMD
jgi:Flp pilus assembly protein TadG